MSCDDDTIESALGLKLEGLTRASDVEMEGWQISIATRPHVPACRLSDPRATGVAHDPVGLEPPLNVTSVSDGTMQ